jgi:hypothetical protein
VDFLDNLTLTGHTLSGADMKSNVDFLRKKTAQILLF